ncbi:glycosyltransferase family 4 protein [Marinicellulosiphila megalodicopiae]|uniref:glycosyltransferase family 4 protein n=1 Tax=Marinicellulosiphila megalodicopiae TaxID=2724896 RepID=UPI003BB170D7
MKILYVVNTYYPDVNGGAPRSVQLLAESMVADGHEAVVVRLSNNSKKELYTHNGVKVYSMPIRNIFFPREEITPHKIKRLCWHILDMFNPFSAFDFWKILKIERPDLVNTNTIAGFSTSIFYVTKWMGAKLVHTMRDYYLMSPQSGMYENGQNCETIPTASKPWAWVRRIASKRVDLFLGNSQFVVDRHIKLGCIKKDALCYNQWNTNGDDEIGEVRTIQTPNKIQFGFIGRINELKGADVLIEACNHVEQNNWSLLVAGSGEQSFVDSLKQNSPQGKVEYLNWVKPEEFYNKIDVLICPSTYHDPLPRVVYEAYKYGIPVIAAATGGTPEMVDHGQTGFLYDAKDTVALTRLMDHLCKIDQDEYQKLSFGALEKAKLFTRTEIITSYKNRINEALS